MRHHRLPCAFGVTGENGLHHGLVLFGQTGEYRRDKVHPLAALFDRGLQEVEKAAHGL